MTDKIQALLNKKIDLSSLDDNQARYVQGLIEQLEQAQNEKSAMLNNRLGLHWSSKSYDERFDDWEDDAVVPVLDAELSRPEGDTGNLIIEGDNIDALRVLARTHKGKVDCIFIDPPYNTETTQFVYNDDFVAPEDKYRYSMWLEGLKRRLQYVPDLLSDTGVLLVAINDQSRVYIELCIRENIMPGKFLGSAIWKSRSSTASSSSGNLSVDHENVLIFANENFSFGGGEVTRQNYKFDDGDGKGFYARGDITLGFSMKERPNLYYPIQDPKTGLWYPCSPYSVWRFASENRLKEKQKTRKDPMEELIRKNKIFFPNEDQSYFWADRESLNDAIMRKEVPKNGKGVPLLTGGLSDEELNFWVGKRVGRGRPAYKRHLTEIVRDRKPLSSLLMDTGTNNDVEVIISGGASEGDALLKSMFHDKVFNYSKPVSLLEGLIERSTSPFSVVLDFFGGSGTTAEAVLRINQKDDGNRRFIMVSNTERTDKDPDKNLCRDVLRRRVNAVMDGFTKGKKDVPGTGGGYAYLRMHRYDDEQVCGPAAPDMTIDMALTVCQISFDLPVEDLTKIEADYVVRETEDTVYVFVRKWEKALTEAVSEAFKSRPGKTHIVVSDRDKGPQRDLHQAGCVSAQAIDAIHFAGRICGPALISQRS